MSAQRRRVEVNLGEDSGGEPEGVEENNFFDFLTLISACPVNFEFMNYTIITSRCKEPNYTADLCCPAFKEFACPFFKELSDQSNDCSSVMFSYINRHGNYSPGVFSSLRHDDKVGLLNTTRARK